jgi:predicted nucleic acid-binding protein
MWRLGLQRWNGFAGDIAWVENLSIGSKPMPAERFIDTNILLYGYDCDAGSKRDIALPLIEEGWKQPGRNVVSVQVLQEFYVNFLRLGQAHEEAVRVIEDLTSWPVIDNSLERFGHGLILKERFQVSLWDAMILAAAQASGARELLTEDLNPGQDYDGVRAVNPFA